MNMMLQPISSGGSRVPVFGTLLAKLFGHPLRLPLSRREFMFLSPADFEFALGGRTTVPMDKYLELLRRPMDALHHEAVGIKKLEDRFVEALERCLQDPSAVGAAMREFGLKLFSKDHDWRTIIETLNGLPEEFNEYRRIALVKYLQYLSARHEVLNAIYQIKAGDEPAEFPDLFTEPMPSLGTKETVIFDIIQIQDSPRLLNPYERLPRGEPVLLRLPAGQQVDILLARHRFKLASGRTFRLIDEVGHEYALQPGRNVIGRSTQGDVMIDNAYRSVSRKHLIIEPLSNSVARLIDMSSHGTYLPPQYLDTVH